VKEVTITIPGTPHAKGRPRFRNVNMKDGNSFVQTYTDKDTVNYENLVKVAGQVAMKGAVPFKGSIKVSMSFCYPPLKSWSKKKVKMLEEVTFFPKLTKPDIDNCVKSILDGLNEIVFDDDKQVYQINARKVFFKKAQTIVKITEMEE